MSAYRGSNEKTVKKNV